MGDPYEWLSPYDPPAGGHIREHYVPRWSKISHSNLRQVSSRVAVAVREDTTYLAPETMLFPLSKRAARTTHARGVGGVYIFDSQPGPLSLVLNEGLQLPPSPSVQSGANSLAHTHAVSDISEVLHYYCRVTARQRFPYYRGAYLMVDVFYMTRFPARDSQEQLFCGLRTVALKSRSKRGEAVAPILEQTTSVKAPAAGCRKNVLTEVDSKETASTMFWNVRKFKDQVEVPSPASTAKLCLTDRSASEVLILKSAEAHRQFDASSDRKDGQNPVRGYPISPRVKMHRAAGAEGRRRHVSRAAGPALESARSRSYGVADHLRTEIRHGAANGVVGEMMEPHAIDHAGFGSNRAYHVACVSVGDLHFPQRGSIALTRQEPYRDRSLHVGNLTVRWCQTPVTVVLP